MVFFLETVPLRGRLNILQIPTDQDRGHSCFLTRRESTTKNS